MNHQSRSLASQATAELPKLPVPSYLGHDSDDGEIYGHRNEEVRGYGLACYEAGRASRAQSEWISVEDRLPDVSGIEDGETVLVANRGGSFAAEWHGTGITGFSSIHGDQFIEVTHWQPLPSPPATLGETK